MLLVAEKLGAVFSRRGRMSERDDICFVFSNDEVLAR